MDRSGSGSMLIERSHRHAAHETIPYTRSEVSLCRYNNTSQSTLTGCYRRILHPPASSRKLQSDVDKVGVHGCKKISSQKQQQQQPQLTSVCSKLINGTINTKQSCNLFCGLTLLQHTPYVENLVNGGTATAVTRGITCDQLAQLIQSYPKSILILDCRSFLSRSAQHISGSVGVNCTDPISRKRLLRGKSNVGDFVLGQDAKNTFKSREQSCLLIVYDDDTTNIESASAPLKIVISCLQRQQHRVCYLQGGCHQFHDRYPSLCVQQKSSSPNHSSAVINDNCDAIDSAPCSEITPYLYVGNEQDASDLDMLRLLGITHIINATSHLPSCFENNGIVYKRISITDGVNQDIRQHFCDAIKFIDDATEGNGRVLVHCQAGVSRSPTIAIAYVMAHNKLSMLDAFQYVKNKRSIVAPNLSFMGQLMSFEEDLKNDALTHRSDELGV